MINENSYSDLDGEEAMIGYSGWLAGNPFVRLRKKRAGQWGDRARAKRSKRLARARAMRDRLQAYRWEEGDRANRAARRAVDQQWREIAEIAAR